MVKRIGTLIMVIALFSFFTSGCYYFSAKKEIGNAEKLLSELKGAGGEKKTPYEYCSAQGFLEASRVEFSQNDFGPDLRNAPHPPRKRDWQRPRKNS